MTETQAREVARVQRKASRLRWISMVCAFAAGASAIVGGRWGYWENPFILAMGAIFAYLASLRREMELLVAPITDAAEEALSRSESAVSAGNTT